MYDKVKDFAIQAYRDHEVEIIEFYKLFNEVQRKIDNSNDDDMEQFTESVEKYQRETSRYDDDER